MQPDIPFRSQRLSGRPPDADALPLYDQLFRGEGKTQLDQHIQEWSRHHVAPWTLSHAGLDVGIGGFRIGFGGNGLELSFHFVERVWGQGLASEFVRAAIDHATAIFKEDRFYATPDGNTDASARVLEKAGFRAAADAGADRTMYLHAGA